MAKRLCVALMAAAVLLALISLLHVPLVESAEPAATRDGGASASGGGGGGASGATSQEVSGGSKSASNEDEDEEDPDKASDDDTDKDDEDGNKIAPKKRKRRATKSDSDSGGSDEIEQVEKQGEDKALKEAVKNAAECSQKRVNSTCGPVSNSCSSMGKCQEGGFTCEGKFRTVLASCLCPDTRRGPRCERAAVTSHKYDCQLKNACGGRGTCVKLRTESTDEGYTVHHGCACDEGFGGPGCHYRTGVAIGETVNGDLVKAVPNNGGYFAFLEMFRARLTAGRRR